MKLSVPAPLATSAKTPPAAPSLATIPGYAAAPSAPRAAAVAALSEEVASVPSAVATPAVYADIGEVPDPSTIEIKDYTKPDDRLAVYNPDPQLEYRWVNSDSDRYQTLFRRGYRPVNREGAATSDVTGTNPQLRAGTEKDGSARNAILMARPKSFRTLQDENFRRMVHAKQASLDPKRASGLQGADAASFQGQIVINGR